MGVFIAPTTKRTVGEGFCRMAHRTVRCASHVTRPLRFDRWSFCLLGHRTIRWCTGLSGAPCDNTLPTTIFGGWGYKYPTHPTFNGIQVFRLPTPYKSYNIQIFNTRHTKEIKSSPKSKDHSNQIVTRERETCVHLSSCAWIAFLLPSFLCSTQL